MTDTALLRFNPQAIHAKAMQFSKFPFVLVIVKNTDQVQIWGYNELYSFRLTDRTRDSKKTGLADSTVEISMGFRWRSRLEVDLRRLLSERTQKPVG